MKDLFAESVDEVHLADFESVGSGRDDENFGTFGIAADSAYVPVNHIDLSVRSRSSVGFSRDSVFVISNVVTDSAGWTPGPLGSQFRSSLRKINLYPP